MEKTNPKFYIETVSWSGTYQGEVLTKMREEGELLAKLFVWKNKDDLDKGEVPSYIDGAVRKQFTAVSTKNFRIDFQGFTLGKHLKNCKAGLAPEDKFARYEIQENGKTGKTAIAQVFIPTGETIDGQIVLDAFTKSMLGDVKKTPFAAVIRKV